MHFGHPRTITTFKNRNFLKIWVFQGFPYTRVSHFEIHFWPENFKNLGENAQGVMKKCKKFRDFSKIFKTPQKPIFRHWEHFGVKKSLKGIKKALFQF